MPFILFLSFITSFSPAHANPAQVVIVRHAEKPNSGNEVNPQGCERAYLLSNFFDGNSVVNQYGSPVAIFAANPTHTGGSVRSLQTVAATANLMQLAIDNSFSSNDGEAMVTEVMNASLYQNKTVLIAWEHADIPKLAIKFGVKSKIVPNLWPDTVFDQAWVIRFEGSASLEIIPENVLSTDNPLGGANWNLGPTSPTPPNVSTSLRQWCKDNWELDGLVKQWLRTPIF